MTKRKTQPSKTEVALTFTTALAGDEVRSTAGTFVIKQKSACEHWLDLVPSDHRTHAYPTRVCEFDFNRAGYTLVKAGDE